MWRPASLCMRDRHATSHLAAPHRALAAGRRPTYHMNFEFVAIRIIWTKCCSAMQPGGRAGKDGRGNIVGKRFQLPAASCWRTARRSCRGQECVILLALDTIQIDTAPRRALCTLLPLAVPWPLASGPWRGPAPL